MKRPRFAAVGITHARKAPNGAFNVTLASPTGNTQDVMLSPSAARQLLEALLATPPVEAGQGDGFAPLDIRALDVHPAEGGVILELFLTTHQSIKTGVPTHLVDSLKAKLG